MIRLTRRRYSRNVECAAVSERTPTSRRLCSNNTMKSLPIPEQEQLQALASGLKDVYRLLAEYVGDLNKVPKFRQHITVTKAQLAEFLRREPHLAEQHVSRPSDPKHHEFPVLERIDGKYRVYEIDHDQPRYVKEFADLADAAAEYLMWGW